LTVSMCPGHGKGIVLDRKTVELARKRTRPSWTGKPSSATSSDTFPVTDPVTVLNAADSS
jgi:hypothetical protein